MHLVKGLLIMESEMINLETAENAGAFLHGREEWKIMLMHNLSLIRFVMRQLSCRITNLSITARKPHARIFWREPSQITLRHGGKYRGIIQWLVLRSPKPLMGVRVPLPLLNSGAVAICGSPVFAKRTGVQLNHNCTFN